MEVNVYKFEYELIPSMNSWTAFIAASTADEALNHLTKVLNKQYRVLSNGVVCRLDDVSTQVRMNIIESFMSQNKSNVQQQDIGTSEDITKGVKPPKATRKTTKK